MLGPRAANRFIRLQKMAPCPDVKDAEIPPNECYIDVTRRGAVGNSNETTLRIGGWLVWNKDLNTHLYLKENPFLYLDVVTSF